MKLREGNVFSHVCLSTRGRGSFVTITHEVLELTVQARQSSPFQKTWDLTAQEPSVSDNHWKPVEIYSLQESPHPPNADIWWLLKHVRSMKVDHDFSGGSRSLVGAGRRRAVADLGEEIRAWVTFWIVRENKGWIHRKSWISHWIKLYLIYFVGKKGCHSLVNKAISLLTCWLDVWLYLGIPCSLDPLHCESINSIQSWSATWPRISLQFTNFVRLRCEAPS